MRFARLLQSACQFTLYITDIASKEHQITPFKGVHSDADVLLDADIAMRAAAQPQINPLRATENPHPEIMTGLLALWHPQQHERPYCRRAAGTGVRTFVCFIVFSRVTVGCGTL